MMPVKAGGRGAALGAGGEEGAGDADPPDAPLLPHPMRLKYTIGKIIGNIHYLKKKILMVCRFLSQSTII